MQTLRQSSILRASASCSRAKRHHHSTSTNTFRFSFTSYIPTARTRSLKFSSHGHHRPSGTSSRGYATYRDVNLGGSGGGGTSTIPESSLLSQTLDQKHNDARGRDTVGPFGLGVAPQTYYSTPEKKWSELSMKGKITRTATRTTNLTVILFGAGFSALLLYSLTSELFSKNSPTVLFDQACEKIKNSSKVSQYIDAPLAFHHYPPSSTRPKHRNSAVSSQVYQDNHGNEHMLLTFYVRSRPKGMSLADEDEMFMDAIYQRIRNIPKLSWAEIAASTRNYFDNARQRTKVLFLYLTGQPDPSVSSGSTATAGPGIGKTTEIGKPTPETEKRGVWSFAGLFSGLKGKSSTKSSSSDSNSYWDTKWNEGEVHAHLVRKSGGDFKFKYIYIDFPTSRLSTREPLFVERAPEVRDQEILRWY